eukprot:2032673-Ditylum_brightwellii.AAC.1
MKLDLLVRILDALERKFETLRNAADGIVLREKKQRLEYKMKVDGVSSKEDEKTRGIKTMNNIPFLYSEQPRSP